MLDRSQVFEMLKGKKTSAVLPKKSFNIGVVIPAELRFFKACNDKIMRNRCNIQVNENKEFEANLYLLNIQAANQFDHMLA